MVNKSKMPKDRETVSGDLSIPFDEPPTPKIKIPNWAPQYLVDHYEFYRDKFPSNILMLPSQLKPRWRPEIWHRNLDTVEMERLFLLWSTRDEMKCVWSNVGIKVGDDLNDAAFYFCTFAVSLIADFKKRAFVPPRARLKRIDRVVKAIDKLRVAIELTPEFHGAQPLRLLTDEALEKLVHNATFLTKSLEERCQQSGFFTVHKDNVNNMRDWLSLPLPTIHGLLGLLADHAKEIAKASPPVKHAWGPKAEVHFFLKYMSQEFEEKLDARMDETVAAFASVTFDRENIDSKLVASIRQRHG